MPSEAFGNAVAALAAVYLLVALTEKAFSWSTRRGPPTGKEFEELRGYTHVNVHELRNLAAKALYACEVMQVEITKSAENWALVHQKVNANSERIGRLEASMGESMGRLISLVESVIPNKGERS